MKKIYIIPLLGIFLASGWPTRATEAPLGNIIDHNSSSVLVAARKSKKPSRRRSKKVSRSNSSDLSEALRMAKNGQYREASQKLFRLSHSPRYRKKKAQIKYILGLTLYQMKLYQVAAFQFIGVIKMGDTRYLKKSLEKLSLAADALGDDTLLNYAIARVKVEDFPRVHRDMLYFRIGEYQLRTKQYDEASKSLGRVRDSSSLYPKAQYLRALSYAESKKEKRALRSFEELIDSRTGEPVTDKDKVAGLIGKARVLYQMKNWDEAIEAYRHIPKDTEAWHNTLFESSWAMLRSGRFRSAMSNFQSLHSAYYEDFYLPESLLLRSIVYLYICKYDEMDKVLNLFNKIYKPLYKNVRSYLKKNKDPMTYYNEVVTVLRDYKKHGSNLDRSKYKVPFILTRHLLKEGDFNRSYHYIQKLSEESKRIDRQPSQWRKSSLGKYSRNVLKTRLKKAQRKAGRQLRSHFIEVKDELFDLFEQEGFVRFEMINGKKEALKKKVAGKDLPTSQVDQTLKRDYYIQNGFEYWKFQGEYWLDELGNYHYVGMQSCN